MIHCFLVFLSDGWYVLKSNILHFCTLVSIDYERVKTMNNIRGRMKKLRFIMLVPFLLAGECSEEDDKTGTVPLITEPELVLTTLLLSLLLVWSVRIKT